MSLQAGNGHIAAISAVKPRKGQIMAYKDADKQKQANKEAAKRYRDTKQGMTVNKPEGMTKEGMTDDMKPKHIGVKPDGTMYQIDACGTAHEKLAEGSKSDKPVNVYNIFHYGKPDCQCMHCQQNRHSGDKHIINHGAYKKAEQLKANELNRVSLPGDVDYVKATEPVVQSIWNRRNEQEQPVDER